MSHGVTVEPRCLWIEPNGRTHRCYNGGHAGAVRRACPSLAAGCVLQSEVRDAAFRAGWLLVVWMGGESKPDTCSVLDVTGAGVIPGAQMDAWLAWRKEMGVKPSELEVLSRSSRKAAIWGGSGVADLWRGGG